jgi:hypothetical protein
MTTQQITTTALKLDGRAAAQARVAAADARMAAEDAAELQPPFIGWLAERAVKMLTLDQLAEEIKADLATSDDCRVAAARKLAAVQTQLQCDPKALLKWCSEHQITIGRSELYFLLAVAKAPDPAAKVAAERARAREGMQRHREEASADDDDGEIIEDDDDRAIEDDEPVCNVTDAITIEELKRRWEAFGEAYESASKMVRELFKAERREFDIT